MLECRKLAKIFQVPKTAVQQTLLEKRKTFSISINYFIKNQVLKN